MYVINEGSGASVLMLKLSRDFVADKGTSTRYKVTDEGSCTSFLVATLSLLTIYLEIWLT